MGTGRGMFSQLGHRKILLLGDVAESERTEGVESAAQRLSKSERTFQGTFSGNPGSFCTAETWLIGKQGVS